MVRAKQNNPGLGIEYEVYVPAYYALLLNVDPEIEDFKLQSNVEEFGNLDDLLIDIKTKKGENFYFAFQLKHKEKSNKNLLPTNFEVRGDFNLEKYCETFKKFSEENRNKYHFILYTNKNFDSSCTNEVQKFVMKHDECCLGRDFFDTSNEGKHLYKFEVNEETEDGKNVNKKDYEEFFSKFSLYTGQANIRKLEESILNILKYKECYATYIEFFRKWHRGDFADFNNKTLVKETLNVHLVDIFLSSVAINYNLSFDQDKNKNFFEEMVQQFDITIIDASKQDFINTQQSVHKYSEEFNKKEDMIRLAKDHKFMDRFTKELKEETKLKLLYYFHQKPLILDFNTNSKDLIYKASELCKIQENEIKLVILGRDIVKSKFSHMKIFTNLTEVDGNFLEEIKKRCNLSLQGRNISFEEIFEDEIRTFVTPREILQMLKGNFSIGEGKESLPECYIPRTVSATIFDIDSIIKCSSRNAVIIFYCEERFKELKILIHDIVNREDYLYEDFLDAILLTKKKLSEKQLHQDNTKDTSSELPAIILRKEECSRQQLDEIREKIGKDDVRLFKVIDETTCVLLMSTKKINNENYKCIKMSVEENNIHVFFNNSINILCAQPGMGKSTIMKYLKNESGANFWTVMVDLKAHNQFLKKNHKIEDVLNYFLELESGQDSFLLRIKRMFLEKRKIVLFLDGLDEVEQLCVDRVLEISKLLGEMGFRIWLSSRQNLQQKLEEYFNIIAIEINEVSENQQKYYIENRLRRSSLMYNKTEIEEIVDKIFNNTNLTNNCQVLEIPLQLQIITQIFLDDKSYYSNINKNNFVLTKMFEIFFEGKYNHFLAKFESKNSHLLGGLEGTLENYEIVALHSVLDDEHFLKLQIEKPTQFKNWDFLGIIAEINSGNKAVFEHLTFAEYFASKFLVKNVDKARVLKEEIFSEKYQNLLLIFNIMLAEDSPLHLAIIYKDISRIQELDESPLMDKGGRNFLQVAACVATRHPSLDCSYRPCSECCVKDKSVQHFKGEDLKVKGIISRVLPGEPLRIDKIFGWNSLDYALAAGALYIVEAILQKFEKPPNFYEMLVKYYSDEVVAYYSIRFGYNRLLFEILAKKSCHVPCIVSDFLCYAQPLYRNNSIFHFLFFTSDCTNRIKIIKLLTCDDINKTVYDKAGYTLLHFAVLHEDIEFLNLLLQKRADVNVTDVSGSSPLLLAVEQNSFEISKMLVEKGADVNIINAFGKSPMFYAFERNNLEISKLLIEKGADVNVKYKDEWSPLFWAVDKSNLEILKFLIENGADINIKDKDRWSPLLAAVNQNNLAISTFLIEKGADINIKDKDGWSPLLRTAKQSNFEISKLLVEGGADVNIKDKDGWSPLLWTAEQSNFEISKLLVEGGADVNIKDKDGWSPLFWAVDHNNLENSKFLIEKGAYIDIKDKEGYSPLFWAVYQNNFEISKLLVEKGADINIKDEDGKSPLFVAVKLNYFKISKYMIEKGADINIKDKDGWSPLFWAIDQSNLEISELAVEKEADIYIKDKDGCSHLFGTVHESKFEISKFLIEKGAEINIKDKEGCSPLFWAVYQNNLEISKLLVENGADINMKDEGGRSPLFVAIKLNNLKISKFLIEKGSDVNIKDTNGWLPLLWTSNQSNLEISKVLVERGADINMKDEDGWSPLFWAVDQGNLEISKFLIEKGAEINIKDKYGYSLLFWAIYQSDLEILKLLIEKGANINIKDEGDRSPLFLAVKLNNLKILKFLNERSHIGSDKVS